MTNSGNKAMNMNADEIRIFAVANEKEKAVSFFFTKETASVFRRNTLLQYDEDAISPILHLDLISAKSVYEKNGWAITIKYDTHPDQQTFLANKTVLNFDSFDADMLIYIADKLKEKIGAKMDIIRSW